MKKTLILCLLLLAATSCEKKYCWKCAMTTITRDSPAGSINTGYQTDTTVNNSVICDKTASEIKAVEGTTSSDLTQGNIIVNKTTTTTCNH